MAIGPVNREIYKNNYGVGGFAESKGYILTFTHLATGHKVSFPSAIQEFSDQHTPQISERIFAGRGTDPMIQQAGTTRQISFTFAISNSSVEEARYNQQSINLLIQMLYPRLSFSATDTSGSPYNSYMKISGLSFLKDTVDEPSVTCYVNNISYSLDPTQGFITPNPGELYPIVLTISIEAIALIPEIRNAGQYLEINEEAILERLDDSDFDTNPGEGDWKQPFPPSYPSYK